MSDITFRDFAGAIMQGDPQAASKVLQTLLGVDGDQAAAATAFFQEKMATGPEFMMKAMGMRTVVENKDEPGLVTLLGECFGLDGDTAKSAAGAVLSRYA